jgi:type IV pilus assembly protein PilQ
VLAVVFIPTSAAAGSPTCRVSAVELRAGPDGQAEVAVTSSRTPSYTVRVAKGGRRLVVDLRDAVAVGADPAIVDSVGVVSGVMTQTFRSQGVRTTRLLVQLTGPAGYRVVKRDRGLSILLSGASKTGPASPATSKGTGQGDEDGTRGAAATHLRDLRYQHGAESHRVVLDFDTVPAYRLLERAQGRTILELRATATADRLVRKLDVSAFAGPVQAISVYRQGDRVLVDVDHATDVSAVVTRYGTRLHYIFSAVPPHSMLTGIAPDGRAARRARSLSPTEADKATAVGAVEEWTSEPDRAGAFLPSMTPKQARRYTGRRIDLDLKDADIHNVLRLISDVGRVNIVTADNVDGTVTIRMRNVPWDLALDTVLQAKGLGLVRRGNIIRVAQQEDLEKERELAIAKRKSELELAPIETRLIPVSYAGADDLQTRAADLLSPRGSLAVDERTNVLIARDVAGNLNQVEELIRALDTQTPQVLIEARIVEATSRFTRDVGLQWGGDMSFGPATGNDTGLVFPNSVGVVGGASDPQAPTAGLSPVSQTVPNPNFAVNLPAAVGTGSGGALGLSFGSVDNTVNLNVRLSAAEATGMLRIVSSPRILTLDNNEARISKGTLIPFSQISAQGVQTVFQEAKLQLLVKPHVTADGSVSMHVKINRDEPDFNQTSARGDPTILKREAETELLVPDGHTAVIGGIYSRNTGRNIDQVPLLGDIPILGVLFQRRRQSDSRSELVIFITPRIVNRAEALGR